MSEKTTANLRAAFAGESQARNKYTFFAEVARREGLHAVANAFEAAADNEKAHAAKIMMLLGDLKKTPDNLRAAIAGETYEYTEMYPEFAKAARAEGEGAAAAYFEAAEVVESDHAAHFTKLLAATEQGTFLKREKPIRWRCRHCGMIHEGTEPPTACPLCGWAKEQFTPATCGE